MSQIFKPAHLSCTGGKIKTSIGSNRRYIGPGEMADADGHLWAIDSATPKYNGTCPFCGLQVNVKRPWEAVLTTRDQ